MIATVFIALGIVIGVVGTLIGAGGGFILMPALVMMYPRAEPEHLAAMSLAVVCANAISGTVGYARLRRIHFRGGLMFAAAAIPGAIVGALLVHWIPRRAFDAVLGVGLIVMAAWLLMRSARAADQTTPGGTADSTSARGVSHEQLNLKRGVGISAGVGVASSMLGIGGGIIHVPALVHGVGYPVHVAAATSHFVLALTSAAGLAVLASRGLLDHDLDRALMIAGGAVVGAQVGAVLSSRISGHWIIRLLAVALLAMGGRVMWGVFHPH
ncbi:MAG: sulfite exporter TauE/SafE family protein [Phycisphaerales bacterium]